MVIDQEERVSRWRTHPVGRRTVLRGALLGGVGLAAAALIGCVDDDEADTTKTTTQPATATPGASVTPRWTPTPGLLIEYWPWALGDPDEDTSDAQEELVRDPALPYPYNFAEPDRTPEQGEIMRVAATWNFDSLDPVDSAAGGTVTVPNMAYNRLIGFKRGPGADVFQPELEPELATFWERSPDGLTFTFQIHDDIMWQNVPPLNGRKFTAEDAVYALNRYATEGVHTSYYANVAGFEAPDDLTMKVHMARATADFLNPLASNKQTIFPREIIDDGSIKTAAVGTGPMTLTDLEPGRNIEFVKNPDYWEQQVLLDGFEFVTMPDHAARLAQFRVGNIDYAYGLASSVRDLNEVLETNPDVQVNLLPITYTRSASA